MDRVVKKCRNAGILIIGIGLSVFTLFLSGGYVEAAERVAIVDMAGRHVAIPKSVNRIVPVWGAMRYVVYLRAFDKVVGVERVEKSLPVSAGSVYRLALEGKTADLPAIGEGGPDRLPDFEALIAVRPDIIISMDADLAKVNLIQQKTGIPVVQCSAGGLGVFDPHKMQQSLRLLGRILDRDARAEEVIRYLDRVRHDLEKRTEAVRKRPSVYVGTLSFKGRHGIVSTEPFFTPLRWIHGRNVADSIGRAEHVFVDPEQIHAWDPDVVFLDAGGLDMVSADYRKRPDFYLKLRAVRQGAVYLIYPYNAYHTNIETALADAYFMGKVLYPRAFRNIEPAAKADDIYRFFIGVPAYARLKAEYHGFVRVIFDKDGLRRE